jgi:4-amino-4-deoxy-L-arabinose transferase-like glycosyltransferase
METKPLVRSSRVEVWAVFAVAFVGLILRSWPLGQLGLTHFDEGIYAIAGAWALDPRGIEAFDPIVIPYAPPGYPILVGLAYVIFDRGDGAAILVSILAGTLAIPAAAWLARRSFGPGAGFSAACLAALSGPHVAFSRMALTDASFLLVWLVALGMGMRFLEKPEFPRAVAMGLAVGLTQQFKYNGWLAGAIVAATALLGIVVRPEERSGKRIASTLGWGLFGALIAAIVVLPWFLFVERHGGYAALLQHQRSYLVGPGRWLESFRIQCDQAMGLSDGFLYDLRIHPNQRGVAVGGLVTLGLLLASLGSGFARDRDPDEPPLPRWYRLGLVASVPLLVVLFHWIPNAAWWFGLVVAPGLLFEGRPALRILGVGWLVLSVLTPLYHPYARLWLPIHAFGWILVGGTLARAPRILAPYVRRIQGRARPGDPAISAFLFRWGWAILVASLCSSALTEFGQRARPLRGLLDPSDSLRKAVNELATWAPDDVRGFKVYARPALTFYLARRGAVLPQPDAPSAFKNVPPGVWVVIDGGMSDVNQGWAGNDGWELVAQVPSELSVPTMLDNNPDAPNMTNIATLRQASISLFCPRGARKRP